MQALGVAENARLEDGSMGQNGITLTLAPASKPFESDGITSNPFALTSVKIKFERP
jgi:hypothetical protein